MHWSTTTSRYERRKRNDTLLTPEAALASCGGTREVRGQHEIRGLAEYLAAEAWAKLEIPREPYFLGALVTPSTRLFLIGSTGLGKTLLAYAMAAGMATGGGFLGLTCDRPSRWLIIDGEMPTALIKQRVIDLFRREGRIPPNSIIIYSRDRAEEFAKSFPRLGLMEPLNTAAGQAFVLDLVTAIGGVDGIIFDNVMSLIAGDQKDEVPWSETLSLVSKITSLGISQIWLDHTGHNTGRQYGSATKAWRFDAVGIMTPLNGKTGVGNGEVAFTLSFDSPGKARRRTPDNWQDFATRIVRLANDRWTSDRVGDDDKPVRQATVSPSARRYYRALINALSRVEKSGVVSRTDWYAECVSLGLVDAITGNDSHRDRERQRAKFRKYVNELRNSGWIRIDGNTVFSLRVGTG